MSSQPAAEHADEAATKLPHVLQSTFQHQHLLSARTQVTSEDISICLLCQEEHPEADMDSFGQCGHRFCQDCLAKYSIYKISVMEEPMCPQEGCQCRLQFNAVMQGRLPEQTKTRYRRLILWKQTVANPHLQLCPTENCEGLIKASSDKHQCPTCHAVFCRECQLPEHDGPCDSNFQLQFANMKRCPVCRMFISKIDGCNHITCRCGYQFCFNCLADWSDYHYQCGEEDSLEEDEFELADMPYWKRILLALMMLMILPVVLGLLLGFAAVVVFLGPLVGFLLGPIALVLNVPFLQNEYCCIMLFPLLLVAGAILGLCLGVSYTCLLQLRLLRLYFIFFCELLKERPAPTAQSIFNSDGSEMVEEQFSLE